MHTHPPPAHLGFLTVLQDGHGYFGGYLVTNLWGRPLEFRLSTAVQPNKVQQILYGPTLRTYVSADLIGKTLVDKTNAGVAVVLSDAREVLELRRVVDMPVVWIAPAGDPDAAALAAAGLTALEPGGGRGPVLAHPSYPGDVAVVAELLAGLGAGFDVAEPFGRIRDAVIEARKMGVTQRAAG